MDYEETMVENTDNIEADDTLENEVVEEVDESEESLDSYTEEEEPAEEQPEQETKSASEPGYVQRRIEKAVSKALAQQRDSIMAEMEERYAPLRERMLEMDARDLVQKGVVKDIETAKELVRYRQGQPQAEPKPEQTRNDKGQYQSRESLVESAKTEARIDMLKSQADKIRANGGPDVIAEFKNNEDIKQRVVSGELDFYDVAEMMKSPRRKAPAPMRSPNGASGTNQPNAIESMSKEQFARLEKRISEGARIKLT